MTLPKAKTKKGWTVVQIAIIFGMAIVACLSAYYLFTTLTTGGR